jgi:hypothetical protein
MTAAATRGTRTPRSPVSERLDAWGSGRLAAVAGAVTLGAWLVPAALNVRFIWLAIAMLAVAPATLVVAALVAAPRSR